MKQAMSTDTDSEANKQKYIKGLLQRFKDEGYPAYYDPETNTVYCPDKKGKNIIGFEIPF